MTDRNDETKDGGMPYTIPGSGRRVVLHRVSQFTTKDYIATWAAKPENRRPLAPVQVVKGQTVQNNADPDYRAALEDWVNRQNVAAAEATLILGIETPVDMAAVSRVRDRYRRLFDQELPGSDYAVMVLHVCIINELDMQAVQLIIQGKSIPDPEEVDNEIAMFSDNMGGDADSEDSASAE